MKNYNSVFIGNPQISVDFLEKLKKLGFFFDLVITNPDKKQGRKKELTPTPVKKWSLENNSEILYLEKTDKDFIEKLKKRKWDFFLIFANGNILPQEVLDIPKYGVLNIHPSLLPKYRGPSPIISAILDNQKKTGVTIMKINEKMDSGDIIFQKEILVEKWKKNKEMEKFFAELGAIYFFENIKNFLEGKIEPQKQDENLATYCKKYEKKDMEISFPFTEKNSEQNFLKYCAFSKCFYFDQNQKRNIITKANFKNNFFNVEKIIPEGKKERDFS